MPAVTGMVELVDGSWKTTWRSTVSSTSILLQLGPYLDRESWGEIGGQDVRNDGGLLQRRFNGCDVGILSPSKGGQGKTDCSTEQHRMRQERKRRR